MLGYWDWYGCYKIVGANGHVTLVHHNVTAKEWAIWWNEQTGRLPNITTVYQVDGEFYEEWAENYRAKGLLCEGNGGDL